jgi:hypothetical protein
MCIKGANMLTLRQIVNDEKWRTILRGLSTFLSSGDYKTD